MILSLAHEVARNWIDANLDTYVSSIKHREYLDKTPVLTPTGRVKVRSYVFVTNLDVSQVKQTTELLDWLHEQEFDGQWCVDVSHGNFVWAAFANDNDATKFKIVWLENIRQEYRQ